MKRAEDTMYEAWQQAIKETGEQYPEPQTSQFYQVLRVGAQRIIGGIFPYPHESGLAFMAATQALMKAPGFQGRSKFSTWFYKLCRNMAVYHVRSLARRREVQLDMVPEPVAGQVANPLPPMPLLTQEELFLYRLIFFFGFELAEIAKTLNIPYRTANTRCVNLRRKLASILNS